MNADFLYFKTGLVTIKIEKRLIAKLGFDPETISSGELWHILYLCANTPVPPLDWPLDPKKVKAFVDLNQYENDWIAAVKAKIDSFPPS